MTKLNIIQHTTYNKSNHNTNISHFALSIILFSSHIYLGITISTNTQQTHNNNDASFSLYKSTFHPMATSSYIFHPIPTHSTIPAPNPTIPIPIPDILIPPQSTIFLLFLLFLLL
ncbi:hypothetical protein DFH27DRAFT_548992 [Peziza echinospora]|nr:hypothetical protein DFH27DRAFT_548992 [Peziza echinospora]